jgi:hypothetical protein
MLPRLNRKRALFVLTKIDEILAWEKQKEAERDTRFVDLGRYLCGGAVLEARKPEVVRCVLGQAFSGISQEGVLPAGVVNRAERCRILRSTIKTSAAMREQM